MGGNKVKEDLIKAYKEWKDLELKTDEKIKHHHQLKKEEREDAVKRFSEFAKLDNPLTEDEILQLEEYYNDTFI